VRARVLLGLVAYAAIKIIAPTFYALGDSRTPMYVTLRPLLSTPALITCSHRVRDEDSRLALSTRLWPSSISFLLFALNAAQNRRVEASVLLRSLAKVGVAPR